MVLNPVVSRETPVTVRIEIKNTDRYDMVVARDLICETNGPTCLSLEFEDEKGSKHGGEVIHGTMSSAAYGSWWTLLAPGHYYGVEENLEGFGFEFLKVPGHYKITARYVSKGGFTPPSREDWNIPALKAWEGELVSNVATFDVLLEKK